MFSIATAGQSVLDSANRFIDNRSRHEKRKAIRRQLAECERRNARHRELGDAIASLDRECDAAAAQHAVATQPLQDRLSEVEAEIVDNLSDREAVPAATEERRKELLEELLVENTALEQTLDTIKSRKSVLQREINALHKNVTATIETCHSKLCSEALAREDLYHEHFAAGEAARWSELRLKNAQQQYARWKGLAAKVENGELRMSEPTTYARRAAKWAAELSTAYEAHQTAVAAQEEAREAMLVEQ